MHRIGSQYADASNGIGLSIAKQLADEGGPWTAVQAMAADSSPVSAQGNGQPAPTTASRISLLKVIITAPVGNLAVAAETTRLQFSIPKCERRGFLSVVVSVFRHCSIYRHNISVRSSRYKRSGLILNRFFISGFQTLRRST